jgi:hypothetical protein
MRVLLLTSAAAMLLFGCGGGNGGQAAEAGADARPEEPTVVGTWEVAEVVEGDDIGNTGTIYEFNQDGTMCSRMGAMEVEGTYRVVGDTIKITQGTASFDACYRFEGESMLYDIQGGTQVFRMEPRR